MKRAWLVIVAACSTGTDGGDFPVNPGGKPGTGVRVDASMPDAPDPDAGTLLAGRVCLISDLRALTTCAETGAGGITVSLGSQVAVTADDGRFTMMTPTASSLTWRASGAAIVSSVVPFGPVASIPAIGVEDWNELMNANSVVLQPDQGSIVARIVKTGAPQSGATATSSPAAQFATKYDGLTPTAWNELATGSAGTAWLPGVPIGFATVTVTPAAGNAVADDDVRVEDQAITYITIDLP